jgi:hypothetical protein
VAILLDTNEQDILEVVGDIPQSNYYCMDPVLWSPPYNYGPLMEPSPLPKTRSKSVLFSSNLQLKNYITVITSISKLN